MLDCLMSDCLVTCDCLVRDCLVTCDCLVSDCLVPCDCLQGANGKLREVFEDVFVVEGLFNVAPFMHTKVPNPQP